MYFRKLILAFLFIFVCDKLFAATFTVTSNADAGPGTLRQALLDATANGTATTDYIYFNLPGNTPADITITVKTQLPDVTANIVIDGTTQPGPALGVSNAKVIITPLVAAQYFNAFNVSKLVTPTDDVEFYGLYIKDFSPNTRGLGDAIISNAICKLIIGAPGKGNVISGNWYAFLGYFQTTTIQGNLIGLEPDGETVEYNATLMSSTEQYYVMFDGLLVGGDDAADGNVIISGTDNGFDLEGVNATPTTQHLTFKNNLFGTDYTGTKALQGNIGSFINVKHPSANLSVYNNVFVCESPDVGMMTTGTLTVKGNYFGTDRTQTLQLGNGYEAIHIVTGVVATIGGTTPADQNVFTHFTNPIFADNNTTMLILQNSFYCNSYVSVGNTIGTSYCYITNLTNTNISGSSAPGALIQLYYATAPGCTGCNPTTWFANVTADGNGKWSYNGNTTQDILVSSTVNNNTFGFQRYLIYPSDVTLLDFDCHHPGSIKVNLNRTGRITFNWYDNATGKLIGSGREIDNLQPGVYNLNIDLAGDCTQLASGQFTVNDLTTHVYSQTVQLDCNTTTGTFTAYPSTADGITVAEYFWEDANGVVFSHNQTVTGLAAGNYYLYVTDSNGCTTTKVLCQVLPPVGQPVIDDSNVKKNNATCDNSDGSITGITVSNADGDNYYWSRPDGSQLGYGQTDLTKIPAGTYYFNITYDFSCPPVQSGPYTIIGTNAVTIDASSAVITPSTCANSNGSIQGIVITGATKYQWYDGNNTLVGSSADLTGVSAGNYYLVASNGSCTKTSATIAVGNTPAVDNFPTTSTTTDATCGLNNGGVEVDFNAANSPVSYRWTTATGTPLFSNVPLTNVGAGNYNLYVTDGNGCESLYKTYTVNASPVLQIVAGSVQVTNDHCGLGQGAISGITITGGVLPYTYSWVNQQQQNVSANLNLTNLMAGTYTLQVKDATACGLATQEYSVTSTDAFVAPPAIDNLQVCSGGDIMLMVKDPQVGSGYRLYDTGTSTVILDDETSGVFKVPITASRSFYVSQYTGNCESTRVDVTVTIGLSSVNIPNTFTPNNDGVNDLWVINGMENYPSALVQVFNRYGQKVFESKGYDHPFDGKMGGSLLPPGAYYYIINLNSSCKLLSGSLTIIR